MNDAVDNFRSWGLEFPNVKHKYSNDPNANNSAPRKLLFGIFEFVDYKNSMK